MSAYGDMLGAFPELNEAFDCYDVCREINGALNKTSIGTFYGIRQDTGRNVSDKNGVYVHEQVIVVWLTEKPIIRHLFGIMFDGKLYVDTQSENWSREGSFYRCELHAIVGNVQSTNNTGLIQGTF